MERIAAVGSAFFGLNSLVSPVYILAFVLVAGVIYLKRRETSGFIAWVFPAHIWAHKSTRLDIILFAIGRLMSGLGLVARFGVTPLVAIWVSTHLPWGALGNVDLSPVMLGAIFWVVNDFAVYWVHRIHHQANVLWPLHAVHHSAAVMTPLTAYRQHPLGIFVVVAIQTAILGAVYGIIVGTLDPNATNLEIAGASTFTALAVLAMANFHHAHIWISFGPILERIIISPAQHQIHHSTDPAHYNRNFGGMLAIWDWMFGTLYLTGDEQHLTLGLTEKGDAPLMTHRLDLVLIDPLRRIMRAIR